LAKIQTVPANIKLKIGKGGAVRVCTVLPTPTHKPIHNQ
jgi:hypothetical protein